VTDRRWPKLLLLLGAVHVATLITAVAIHGWHPLAWLYAVSWQAEDPTYMPAGQTDVPLLGPHYFGDWQLYLGWARDEHPYVGHRMNYNALPPALWFLKAFTLLPLGVSYIVAVALGVALTMAAAVLLLPDHTPRVQAAAWLACIGLSSGAINCLDRGNLLLIVVGLIGLWVWALRTGRPVAAVLLLAGAVCIKPYLLVLLLWPLAHRAWRTIAWTIATVAVPSLIGLAAQPGPFWATIRGYREGGAVYVTQNLETEHLFVSTPSILGLLLHPVTVVAGQTRTLEVVTVMSTVELILPGLAYLLIVAYVTSSRRLPDSLSLCLVLSLSQLVLPASQGYTMVWAGIGALLLLSDRATGHSRLRLLVIAALLATIVPLPLTLGGDFDVPWTRLLSPTLWVVAAVAAALATATAWRSERSRDEALPAEEPGVGGGLEAGRAGGNSRVGTGADL
jgi:hypothetical protein